MAAGWTIDETQHAGEEHLDANEVARFDVIRLSIVPVLLGGGFALFGRSRVPRRLHLTDETAFESGIVELHYEVRDE